VGRGSTSGKMARLDQLLGRLKSGDACTAALLAKELGISTRTLMRDLDDLKEQGYPIETDQGRGGGVRLHPRWGIGRLALNYREVIDLLLALSVLEKMRSPLLLENLSSIRNKLFASFPDAQRPNIAQFRRRILVGDLASKPVNDSYQGNLEIPNTHLLLEGFFEKKCLTINYSREDGEQNVRKVEIHYLFLNWPVWYLIAWDHFRDAPRTFRIDRIRELSITNENFNIKPLSTFSDELSQFAKPL
jgi:predicted DNA-binding transcriptional regulator YafY